MRGEGSIERMPLETVRTTAVLAASADRVYAAWLDSDEHSRMTGSKASVDPRVGGDYSAWDGYIEGKTLELEPGRRIVQSCRSTDFPLGHADSRLEVHLLDVDGGCEISIMHSEIPEGHGAKYDEGWRERYLLAMKKYFAKPEKAKPPRKKAPKKAAKKAAARRGGMRKAPKKSAGKAAKKAAAKKSKSRARTSSRKK
jgi:uncharacterized protein YndB with AHSA1/START domain